jgi:SPP1 gp7 family putative phage head morphogenesis protein
VPTVAEVAAQYRREIAAMEREAAARLLAAYADAWAAIQGDLRALTDALDEAKRAGVEITPELLRRGRSAIPNVQAVRGETYAEAAERVRQRYAALSDQLAREMARYGRFAAGVVENNQRAAVAAALRHAEGLIDAALGPGPGGVAATFNRLPVGALEELVGALGDGSPLSALFDGYGPTARREAARVLVAGVSRGHSPRQMARDLRAAINGITAVRALAVSRQETLRAYRAASLASFQANPTVKGWRRLSARTTRTCPICWAMDGKEYATNVPLTSHILCRCVMVPITRTWEELGFPGVPEVPRDTSNGPDLFARLPAEKQRDILGAAKFALYQVGDIALSDLVAETHSARWGPGLRERTLAEIEAMLGEELEAAD